MKSFFPRLFLGLLLALAAGLSLADDKDDAEKAATSILSSIRSGQYDKLWDAQTSTFFKTKTTKDSFLANMSMGRQQLGKPVGNPKMLDMAYSKKDAATGYVGEIYAFNFLTSYASGNFYERIVVVKENDGKFKLSGLWGAPAQK